MKKILVICTLALTGLICSCENPYVQEILRDGAYLKNITIAAKNNQGETADINYGLNPGFTPENLNYYAFVPNDSVAITIAGITNHDQTVSYRINDGPPQEQGTFPFASAEGTPLRNTRVTLTVIRDYMDTMEYTVMVYRKQPVWITGIRVKTDAGGAALFSLNPGFNASITDYSVGVSSATTTFRLRALKRDFDNVNITVSYSGDGVSDGVADAEETDYYTYTFPPGMQEKTVTITASFPEEDPVPVVYSITIQRARQVAVASGQEDYFSISGSSDHYFYQGEPVSFQVTPPFGCVIDHVTAETKDSGTPVSLDPASDPALNPESKYGNTYGFIMPREGVVLTGSWTAIPASGDTNVRYVWEGGAPYKSSGTGAGDALSWATATNDLQAVIDDFTLGGNFTGPVSQANKSYEIWIARGSVSPNWAWVAGGAAPPWASALTAETKEKDNWCFVLKAGAHIYGGFRGTEETQGDKTARDIARYETVLSGELPGFGNTRHLIIAADITTPTLLDGLTAANSMAGGRAYEITIAGKTFGAGSNVSQPGCWTGAGIVTLACDGALVFSRLTIRDNSGQHAGGVYNYYSSPRFENCTFRGNSVFDYGGAMVNVNSSPVLVNCVITANMARYTGGGIYGQNSGLSMTGGEIRGNKGGGIYIAGSSTPAISLTNVRISGNEADYAGAGGVHIDAAASLVLTNVEISGNKASVNMTGGLLTNADTTTLTNVTIAGNNGYGMFNGTTDKTIAIRNTIIHGNGTNSDFYSTPSWGYSLVGGSTPAGSGNLAGTTNPNFVDPRAASAAPTAAGDYRLKTGSPCINKGNDAVYTSVPGANLNTDKDLAGEDRKQGSTIDMGAYEWGF
jgi:hypothetical protein